MIIEFLNSWQKILNNHNCPVLEINSAEDHVHILLRLSKNNSLANIVEIVKKESSKLIKTIDSSLSNFSWQGGYGAFSVSSSKIEIVKNYILNQKEHHKKMGYQEEIEMFFKEYGIVEYDKNFFLK